LRKVESYEGEVGVLESSLSKLRAHRWGVGNDPEALIEALSMDRGQQVIDSKKRNELITNILTQQQEQVRNVMECQLENMVLGLVARHGVEENRRGINADEVSEGTHDVKRKESVENSEQSTNKVEDQQQMDSLVRELNDLLQLSPEQKKKLQDTTEGIEEERRAIEVVDSSLTAMLSNSWLMNEGIEECTKQFTSILNSTQMSKFLLWSDHNSESIDQLDYVNAPVASAQPSQSPVFVFGIDDD